MEEDSQIESIIKLIALGALATVAIMAIFIAGGELLNVSALTSYFAMFFFVFAFLEFMLN